MTRRVDTVDLVYGVRGHVEVVSVVQGPSVGAPKVAGGTAENARRAGTAGRVHERCGTVFHAEMACSNCGERVPAREVRVISRPGDLDRLLGIRGKHSPKSKEPTNAEQE